MCKVTTAPKSAKASAGPRGGRPTPRPKTPLGSRYKGATAPACGFCDDTGRFKPGVPVECMMCDASLGNPSALDAMTDAEVQALLAPPECKCGSPQHMLLGEPVCLFCLRYSNVEPTHPAYPRQPTPFPLRHKLHDALMIAVQTAGDMIDRGETHPGVRAIHEMIDWMLYGSFMCDWLADLRAEPATADAA